MEFGNPKEAICDAVEKLGVDLLIVGSHGKGALERFVFVYVRTIKMIFLKCFFKILEDDDNVFVWTGLSLGVLAITVLTRLSALFLW